MFVGNKYSSPLLWIERKYKLSVVKEKSCRKLTFDVQHQISGKQLSMRLKLTVNPANIYLFKVNNRNSRNKCEIYSELTIKTPERRR